MLQTKPMRSRRKVQRWILLALVPLWIATSRPPRVLMSDGRAAFNRGAFGEAVENWRNAAETFESQKNILAQVEALVNLGEAYQALGQNRSAVSALEQAVALAEKLQDPSAVILAKNALGSACTCTRQADRAERILRDSLALAQDARNAKMTAVIWHNLGTVLAARGATEDALAGFAEAGALAQQMTNHLLAAKSFANAAAVAVRAHRDADATRFNEMALAECDGRAATHELAVLLARCGQTDEQLQQTQRADRSYRRALEVAEQLNDPRASTYALGYLGHLRETTNDFPVALELTRQAAFLAQQVDMPEALYRWEWQTGRVLRAQNDRQGALAAYRRAAQTLQPIRADLVQRCGAGSPSYREAVARLYYEYADLLLSGGETQATLVAARDIIEQLKSGELEEYLQDECAGVSHRRAARIETVASNTAVIYLIPLADRTEVLVGFQDGLQRFRVPVPAEQLRACVRLFRLNLEKRTSNQYLAQARQLYQWLIAPLKDTLTARRVDTLVFVPDGALRTIPMGALEDGERFLVEQFAIAVTPGLTLMEAQPLARGNLDALLAGLTEGVQNFPPLPYAATELNTVQAALHGPLLLNRQFVTAALQHDFARQQYGIVHFATHGQFDRDIGRSFLLTYDGKLSFDDLETLLQPGQFRGKPIELLTFSACQTAAGDDRAALGLAGVAVKAGARSALGTLWFVHDEATALLMSEFYTRLRAGESKARALQQAQLKVLHDVRFGHPSYWSPYLIIGNWL
jgi:CHAT domain-containing protein